VHGQVEPKLELNQLLDFVIVDVFVVRAGCRKTIPLNYVRIT
jgi:hypothetical protein